MALGIPKLIIMSKLVSAHMTHRNLSLGFFFTLVLIWITMVSPSVFSEESPDCRSDKNWKESLKKVKSPQEEVTVLQEAAFGCPGNLEIVDELGRLFLKQDRPSAAVNAFRAGLLRLPGLVDSLLGAAEAEIALNNYRQAIKFYWVARAIQPMHPQVQAFFSDFREFLPLANYEGDVESPLLKTFFEGRKARDMIGTPAGGEVAGRPYAAYLLAQARALVRTGKTEKAEAMFLHAVSLDPSFREAREAMVERALEGGDYFFRGGNYTKALKRYQKALEWLDDSVSAHIRIAQTLERMPGKQKESLAIYLKAKRLLEGSASGSSEEEQAESGLAIMEGLARVDPNNPVYRKRAAEEELAKAERATTRGRLNETVEAYKRALSWTPEDGRIHGALADILRYVQNGWRDAVRHYALEIHFLKKSLPEAVDPEAVKSRIRHAEKEQARLEKSHTGTLAYLRTKLFLAVEKRAPEAALFIIVFGAVLVFLWRSKTAGVEH